jgi:cephalosporin hydroxylase
MRVKPMSGPSNAAPEYRDSPRTLGRRARTIVERAFSSAGIDSAIAKQFQCLYYYWANRTWWDTYWLGVPVQKCPLDLWVYQEILHEVRPSLIIETGTARGGRALFLGSMCDMLGRGRIVTVDVEPRDQRPKHPRVTYLTGSSTAPEIVDQVHSHVQDDDTILVILDSDHSYSHVRDELAAYGGLVTPGSYLIVEDTNLGGHPVAPFFGPGPMEAVKHFLEHDRRFIVDRSREKFFMTFNPKGFLRRGGLPRLASAGDQP